LLDIHAARPRWPQPFTVSELEPDRPDLVERTVVVVAEGVLEAAIRAAIDWYGDAGVYSLDIERNAMPTTLSIRWLQGDLSTRRRFSVERKNRHTIRTTESSLADRSVDIWVPARVASPEA
jgi:hypothetical protein